MDQNGPDGLSGPFRLSADVIVELTIRAIGKENLSDLEQLIYTLRHRLLEENPSDTLMELEEIVEEIRQQTITPLSADQVMILLERAEAKVDSFTWETLEKAIRQFLGWE